MRGLILAGGAGTRLYPLTAVTNKHLIPVGNIPMIEYPLHTIRNMGVDSVSIVTGGEHFKDIAGYLTSLHANLNFSFHYQRSAGGIAQAIQVTEQFLKGDKVAVILGDNVFEESFDYAVDSFRSSNNGAMLFLKQVPDPHRFGVAEIRGNQILSIEEKPQNPKSDLAVTGLYLYDETLFDKIKTLKPSARGELEVTDLNNLYISEGRLGYTIINGFWSDAGTVESRRRCEEFVTNGLEQRVEKSLPSDVLRIIERNKSK